MIIVSITGPDMRRALAQVAGSSRYADLFEFRVDLIRSADIGRLLASTRKPAIVTCRPKWEGGMFAGSESDRLNILRTASLLGAQFIDIEVRSNPRVIRDFVRRQSDTQVILSYHHLTRRLPDVRYVYRKLVAYSPAIVKFAYPAHDAAENRLAFDFLRLARLDHRKGVAIAMGEAGEPSRILYKKFGGWGTYAAPEDGTPAAPGQIRASLLTRLYRSERLSPSTKVFGVVGGQVRHSKGIFVHNALFARARSNAVYSRFPVRNLKGFMEKMGPLLDGFSVTIPHKQAVMRYLSGVDKTTERIGAVNTVIRKGKRLYGTNTDAPGALDAIESVSKVKGKRILIAGAGGAARAIAFEALRRGAKVLISNRTGRRAKRLAAQFGMTVVPMKGARLSTADLGTEAFDVVVNATSVGMVPNIHETPVDKAMLKGKVVFDVVYNPTITRMLRQAKSVGARIVTGGEMYLNQAVRQSVIFCRRKPDVRLMRRILARES